MSKHTEGPWQSVSIDHDPYTIIGGIDGPDDGRMLFTEVCTVNENAADAAGNARLIAAAPDAIRLAKLVIKYFGDDEIPASLDGDVALRDAAEAFLAKAEGRS